MGASLADSRMVNLRGHFALLALIEGTSEALASLRRTLESDGAGMGLRLETYEAAAAPSSNVEELETRIESAPFAGTPLFMLEGVGTLPQGTSARKLREALGALGGAPLRCLTGHPALHLLSRENRRLTPWAGDTRGRPRRAFHR